jgi:hydroxymethylpyrimidine/phosphomethylpyrimidine kinase
VKATLTIAGSDSVSGAGVQADLKTFAAFQVYGTCAVTAVTSQNTSSVDSVMTMPAAVVRSQIEAVCRDVPLQAVKTGMLASAEIVSMVAETLAQLGTTNVVIDPVMTAGNPGARTLLPRDAVEVMKRQLFPVAMVVTPNVTEAAVLSGIEVRSLSDAAEAARRIFALGPRAVVVKGGHLEGREAVDVLYDGRTMSELASPRSRHGSVHGTGCTFASAIAARLALGDDLVSAVQRAKAYVTGAIEHSFQLGSGSRLLNHFWIY